MMRVLAVLLGIVVEVEVKCNKQEEESMLLRQGCEDLATASSVYRSLRPLNKK